MKVKANRVTDFDQCKNPGDYFFTELDDGMHRLNFLCPCGCGDLCAIRIWNDGHQDERAWGWNRDADKLTCVPSININRGHWHGFLIDGIFKKD